MFYYILKRILQIIPVLIGITIILFTMLYVIPEDPAKLTAPPSGLFLERVYYKGDIWLKELKPAIEISSKSLPKYIPSKKGQDGKTNKAFEREKRNETK